MGRACTRDSGGGPGATQKKKGGRGGPRERVDSAAPPPPISRARDVARGGGRSRAKWGEGGHQRPPKQPEPRERVFVTVAVGFSGLSLCAQRACFRCSPLLGRFCERTFPSTLPPALQRPSAVPYQKGENEPPFRLS